GWFVRFFCFGLLAGAGTLAASSPVVLPGRPMARDRETFEAIDVDKDGRVTKAEYVRYQMRRRFDAADTNKDGKLSKEEFMSSIKNEPRAQQKEEESKLFNGGKDFITVDDFMQNGTAKEISADFDKMDRSKKGYVTMADWTKGKRRAKAAGNSQ